MRLNPFRRRRPTPAGASDALGRALGDVAASGMLGVSGAAGFSWAVAAALEREAAEAETVRQATFARDPGTGEVVLASNVSIEGLRFGFDPGNGDRPGVIVAIHVDRHGVMHVVDLEDARPAGWPGAEELAEIGRRVDRAELERLDRNQVMVMEVGGQLTVDDALADDEDQPDPDVDPLGPGYWAKVDAAGRRARVQQANASNASPAMPDPGTSLMTLHLLRPDTGDDMRTACCGRLIEDLPAVEGFTRNHWTCTCPDWGGAGGGEFAVAT